MGKIATARHVMFNTYAYIKITTEDFPRIILVRKVLKDGAKYFGPKISTSAVRKTIDALLKEDD